MKRITVFCGSNSGSDPLFKTEAYNLGKALAKKNIELVYGGAKVGLMGAVADGTLDNGGRAIGVLPQFLKEKELEHKGLSEIYIVDTMHERKAKMSELCDGIITLPGGFGTLEELFEMLTWAQLALHKKPIGLLNINNYYSPLLDMIETMIASDFLKEEYRNIVLVSNNIEELISKMESYIPPKNDKWFVTK